MKRVFKIAFGTLAAGAAAYAWLVRPWHLRWGATKEDLTRPMPLDEIVPDPNYTSTRAVTIHAPVSSVWPWLVQMGELPRAGFYSYAWIERLLGFNIENASEILPAFQELKPGDRLDAAGNVIVKAIEPNRHLVIGPPAGTPNGNATWAIELVPQNDTTTRLVSRIRARIAPNARGAFWIALLDPGQFVMERKWLLGVKERAEQLEAEQNSEHANLLDELVAPVAEKVEPTAPVEEEAKSLDVTPIGV